MKIKPDQRRALEALDERPLDFYDLADEMRIPSDRAFKLCCSLRAAGLVEWMYPDDEVAISSKGRKTITAPREAS